MNMIDMLHLDFDPYADFTRIIKHSAHISVQDEVMDREDIMPLVTGSLVSDEAYHALEREIMMVDISEPDMGLDGIRDLSFTSSKTDLRKSDTARALSDLEKDSPLEEYQYFVGTQTA